LKQQRFLIHPARNLSSSPDVGEGNELGDRMATLGAQRKEKTCVCIAKKWPSVTRVAH